MRRFLLLLAVWLCAAPVLAQQKGMPGLPDPNAELKGQALITALKAGGFTLYFRHAVRDNSYSEGERIQMADCSTQIPLAEIGRGQSRSIGSAFRTLGIPIGDVIASPFCRTMETARLIAGRVRGDNAVAGGNPEVQQPTDFARLREIVATPPAAGSNRIIVGHHSGFFEGLAGAPGQLEGEAAVFRQTESGRVLVARLRAEDWQAYAAPANALPPAARTAVADPLLALRGQALATALRNGGFTLYIRAPESAALPVGVMRVATDCSGGSTEAGTAEARQIGRAISTMRINVAEAFAGPVCSAVAMARIVTGRAAENIALLDGGTVAGSADRGLLEKLLAAPVPDFAVRVIVGSAEDFVAVAGGPPPAAGEMVVLRSPEAGRWVVIARVQAPEWDGILTAAGFVTR